MQHKHHQEHQQQPRRWRRFGLGGRLFGLGILLAVSSFSFNNIRSAFFSSPTKYFVAPTVKIESTLPAIEINPSSVTAAFDKDNHGGGGESFSACLLWMDDNHRLVEWLAYHYYALTLKHVVIAVDPHSRTSPDPVLDRWRSRMTFEVWSNSNFTQRNLIFDPTIDSPHQQTVKYLYRQIDFYQACARHMQQAGRTWTSFHDVDEFLTVNGHIIKNSDALVGQPGNILQLVKKYSTHPNNSTAAAARRGKGHEFWYTHFQKSCCVTIARALYSAKESTPEEISRGFPMSLKGEFDAQQFDTLRYRHRGGSANGLAKSIIDVSRLKPEDTWGPVTAHKPSWVCPDTGLHYDKLPLGIHHYLGSFESYDFREDARKGSLRSYDVWKEKSTLKEGGVDDILRPWIAGFVMWVGEEEARLLLWDAGLPRD